MRRLRSEHAQVTSMMVVMVVALLFFAGLVLDGGRLLAARREVADVATGAARAGAQAMSMDVFNRDGDTRLDTDAARAAASAYLAAAGVVGGDIEVSDAQIQVSVQRPTPMLMLAMLGIRAKTVTGTGSAELVRGIDEGGDT